MKKINLNPGSVFLTVEKEKGIVYAQTKNGGDINFVRYMLEELGDMVPGEPIPARLFVRYDMGEKRFKVPEIVFDDPNFYQHSFLPFIQKEGIPQAQSLLMADAAFCVANEISLAEAATKNKLFRKDSRYTDFLRDYKNCAPDIFPQIAALWDKMPPVIPGYLFVTRGDNFTDHELTTDINGTKFAGYLQRQLDWLEPGHPLPTRIIARYMLDDIVPFKDISFNDYSLLMREQVRSLVEIYDLADVIYAIKHGLNPLITPASQLKSMPDYREEINRIYDSVPAGLELNEVLLRKSMKPRKGVQHVSSLPEPKGKLGPKIF